MPQDNGLLADKLLADPRVEQARQLLVEALRDCQSSIDAANAPDPKLTGDAAKLLERMADARGGGLYFPYLASGIGNGPWVELVDGSVKLDFITGIGVHGAGHSQVGQLQAGITAALQDTAMQGNLQQHRRSVGIVERLLKLARVGAAPLDHCLLTTSGAMANENALKIAFHNRAPADRVIALDSCFAGRSIATAQLTDRPLYRTGLPTALAVDYIPPADPVQSEESINCSLYALDKHLRRHPGKYAALWLELVAGEGGYYPGSTEYFTKLIQRAKADNLLIIFDEVQTFGRLSKPFAFQHFQLDQYADLVTIGKITQLCATFYGESLKPKGPILSQTFTAASSSIEAAMAMLDEMDCHGCFGQDGNNMRMQEHFASGLQRLASKYPGKLSGPFGCGMMVAFTPGDGSADVAKDMVQALYDAGLMSFVAGGNPARIRYLPPPAVTTVEHIDAALEIMEAVLGQMV